MPVHTVTADALEATIVEIERVGAEDVIFVTPRHNDMVVVTRKRYTARVEYRGGVS